MQVPTGARAYFSLDPRSLAAFRIGIGAVVLLDLADRASSLEAHYTDVGVVPRAALTALSAHPTYSLHMGSGGLAFQVGLFALQAVGALLLVVGLWTRWAALLTYVLLVSVVNRNPLIAGQESFFVSIATWAVFLPLGATWSLDARRRQDHQAAMVLSVGTVAMTLQPLFLYTVATVSKFQYSSWTEGRAVYALLHKAHYVRPLGEFALTIPGFTAFATYSTMAVELAIACFLASPWRRDGSRTAGIALGVAFQAVLFACIDVGLFQPLAVVSTLPLIPRSFWDRRSGAHLVDSHVPRSASPRSAGLPLRLFHETACGLLLVAALASIPPSLRVAPATYPQPLQDVYRVLWLEQRFRMFANMDATPQGWWVAAGRLEDGRTIDAITHAQEFLMERPEAYAAAIPNDRWRKYWGKISKPQFAPFRPFLAEYLCRRWNRNARTGERMISVEVIHVRELATHPGQPIVRRPVPLVHGPCPAGA